MVSTNITVRGRVSKKVFVISPIGADGSEVRINADRFLNYIVKVALPAPEYEVLRADEDDSPYAITESMLKAILESDICVADITGRNPNVMYELALAHAADKKVVIMTGDDGPLPFDIKDMRAIPYGVMPEQVAVAVQQLRSKATHEAESQKLKDLLNPVATAFRSWMDLQRIESESGTTDQAFTRVVENLERKIDKVLRAASLSDESRREVVVRGLAPVEAAKQRVRRLLLEMQSILNDRNATYPPPYEFNLHFQIGREMYEDMLSTDATSADVDVWAETARSMLVEVTQTKSPEARYAGKRRDGDGMIRHDKKPD